MLEWVLEGQLNMIICVLDLWLVIHIKKGFLLSCSFGIDWELLMSWEGMVVHIAISYMLG